MPKQGPKKDGPPRSFFIDFWSIWVPFWGPKTGKNEKADGKKRTEKRTEKKIEKMNNRELGGGARGAGGRVRDGTSQLGPNLALDPKDASQGRRI